MQSRVPDIEEIGSQGQVGTMLFQNAEGQQAGALRLLNGRAEISRP